MSIIDDTDAIGLRLKQIEGCKDAEPMQSPGPGTGATEAAFRTLKALGYTYTDGAEMWKPPLGTVPLRFVRHPEDDLKEWFGGRVGGAMARANPFKPEPTLTDAEVAHCREQLRLMHADQKHSDLIEWFGRGPGTSPAVLDAMKRALKQQSVQELRALLDETEPKPAEPPPHLMPAFCTYFEGGQWIPWQDRDRSVLLHSVRFETGEEWDEINGMRNGGKPVERDITP